MNKVTALGRPVVMNHFPNRLVAILTLAILAVTLVIKLSGGAAVLDALSTAAVTAFAVFLTWAIGREIDPAHDWSAFVALPFALLTAVMLGGPNFIALLFVLLFSRTLSGCTGMRPTISDSILLIILGAILFCDGIFMALIILALVFFSDAFLKPPNQRQIFFGVASLFVFGLMFLFVSGIPFYLEMGNLYNISALLLLLAAVVVLFMLTGREQIPDDMNHAALQKTRVRLAQSLPALFVILELILKGDPALLLLYPTVLAYYGAAFYHLGRLLKFGGAERKT